ncbi:cation channel sperm-associated protein 1-like isoform X1 [Clytia hemisphaerica]|uniref:Ion transport domain-containing protein n=3 Tax=Clytia hemisphaerica TaxID=252671 RepID=A0A7M5X3M3_9CNID
MDKEIIITAPSDIEMVRRQSFHSFVIDIVDSKLFGGAILFIILLNTVILIVQTDEETSVKGGWYIAILDNVFLAIYMVELVLKLYALRWTYFKTGWNVMDFIIVLCTTIDFILPTIVQNVGYFDVAAIFKMLKMFRAIRALRALRVLRTIRFLKNLQVIMTTILKSFRALSTIVMLQGLFLYMFAVIGRGLFYEVSPNRFGSMSRAFFTLFQLITLDDWYYMYTDVIELDSDYGFIIVYLMIYIVLENFIFLNLFVAVLVDNFQRTLNASEASKKRRSIRTVFANEKVAAINAVPSVTDELDSKYSFEGESSDDSDSNIHRPIVEDYYSINRVPEARERELLTNYFTILAGLDYNVHQHLLQQNLLNELVDASITMNDVPEELI